jgi:hypothetical protein
LTIEGIAPSGCNRWQKWKKACRWLIKKSFKLTAPEL